MYYFIFQASSSPIQQPFLPPKQQTIPLLHVPHHRPTCPHLTPHLLVTPYSTTVNQRRLSHHPVTPFSSYANKQRLLYLSDTTDSNSANQQRLIHPSDTPSSTSTNQRRLVHLQSSRRSHPQEEGAPPSAPSSNFCQGGRDVVRRRRGGIR